jgi:hypothetical protein
LDCLRMSHQDQVRAPAPSSRSKGLGRVRQGDSPRWNPTPATSAPSGSAKPASATGRARAQS